MRLRGVFGRNRVNTYSFTSLFRIIEHSSNAQKYDPKMRYYNIQGAICDG